MNFGIKDIRINTFLVTLSLAAWVPNLSAEASSAPAAAAKATTQATTPSDNNASPTSPSATKPASPATSSAATAASPTSSSAATIASPASTPAAAAATTSSTTTSVNSDQTATPTPAAGQTTSSTAGPTTSPTSTDNKTPPTNATATSTSDSSDKAKDNVKASPAAKQKAIQEFVKDAAVYIKENGEESSMGEFNKKDGLFTKDSLYVFAINHDGAILATMDFDQKMLGTNQLNFKDPDGMYVIKRIIEKAKSGGGWILYKTENPVTKTIECKNSFIMPMSGAGDNDYIIGSGYYYPISPNGKCEAEKP